MVERRQKHGEACVRMSIGSTPKATPFGMIKTVHEAEAFIGEHRRKARRRSQRNDDQS